jgi:hypothetical protein
VSSCHRVCSSAARARGLVVLALLLLAPLLQGAAHTASSCPRLRHAGHVALPGRPKLRGVVKEVRVVTSSSGCCAAMRFLSG